MFGNAESYERFMGRWSRLLAPLLVNFTSPRDFGQILDVGSGTGALAFSIARLKTQCRVVGIDPSKEFVEFAASNNPFPDRLRFETGDAQQLRFTEGAFEASLSLLVFNFIPDYRKALREIVRVIKPHGAVSAAVWDYGGNMQMLRSFWDAVASVDPAAEKFDERHMPLCRKGELGELWKEAGMQRVEERPLTATARFSSFADYWEPFLLGQGPAGAYVRRIDDRLRAALRDELKRRLAPKREAISFSMAVRAWAVRGVVPNRA